MITLRNELQIQNDLNSKSEWYLYCPWSMDILLPASSGIGPGKYSQSGTGFLLKHGLEDTDRLAWICPCTHSELEGILSQGFLVLSPLWGVVLWVHIIIPGYLTLQLSWHFSSCTGLFGFRHTAGQAVVSRVSSYLRLVMQCTICLYVIPKYS